MAKLLLVGVFLYPVAALANVQDFLLPTQSPTGPKDARHCTTEQPQLYFHVPKPTGALLSALQSYNNDLIKDCAASTTNVYGYEACDFPAPAEWCAFSTAAPTAVRSDFSDYASTASSWWAARNSDAVELAEECPHEWFKAMLGVPGGAAWLNQTLILGQCYADAADASPTSGSSSGLASTTQAPTTAAETGSLPTSTKPTTTPATNSVTDRMKAGNVLIIAAASITLAIRAAM